VRAAREKHEVRFAVQSRETFQQPFELLDDGEQARGPLRSTDISFADTRLGGMSLDPDHVRHRRTAGDRRYHEGQLHKISE
jgi:hypothetical protein